MKYFNQSILSLILLALVMFQANLNYSMEAKDVSADSDLPLIDEMADELAIQNIETALLDVNNIEQRKENIGKWQSMLISAIDEAMEKVAWGLDISNHLPFIGKLLQIGFINKLEVSSDYTPLEKALRVRRPYLDLVRLLLNYGGVITEKVKSWLVYNPEKIQEELCYHIKLREKALIEPTKELLIEAISSNNLMVAKLIIKHKNEFVESSDLDLTENTTMRLLIIKALEMKQKLEHFNKIALANEVPIELVGNIKKIALYNTQY